MTIPMLAKQVIPARWLWRMRVRRWNLGFPDPELRILPRFCRHTCVDVGASLGLYTMHMLGYAKAVWAFEPRGDQAARLRSIIGRDPRVHIESVALSDLSGTGRLRSCVEDFGRSTLEQANPLMGLDVEAIAVTVRTLDSYRLSDVGCIKIDVEGHEEAVLRGANETIERNLPALIVELEDRHNPGITERVPRWLSRFGYRQYVLRDGQLTKAEAPSDSVSSNSIFLCAHHLRLHV